MDDRATADKRVTLLGLALKRKADSWPSTNGYKGIGEYHSGAYECDLVSPYTRTAGNMDSAIFILLQDWSSHHKLAGPFVPERVSLGHEPLLRTNQTLKRLLLAHFGKELSEVYGTNVFPFVKPGGLSTPIPPEHLKYTAIEYAVPEMRSIEPKLVVCLGFETFNAVRAACGLPLFADLGSAISSPFDFERSRVWCQVHTGYWGQINRNRGRDRDGNRIDRVTADWCAMKADAEASGMRLVDHHY